MTRILGIETSCDETAAAVVVDGRVVESSVVSSQVDVHARYGGVVPEIASRAHVELIGPVVADALGEAGVELRDVDAVAACHGPGLAGALLVGVSAAKALALVADVPYVGVNHLEAHLHAAWLDDPDLALPAAVLIVSGGHTMVVVMEAHGRYRIAGQTVDDAAGEAFDKVARHLGLGYPGGPAVDRIARDGNEAAIAFPRAMPGEPDFSFSGLKTAVVTHVRRNPDTPVADVAASFQAAVVDQLADEALRRRRRSPGPRRSSSAAGSRPTRPCGLGCWRRPSGSGLRAFVPPPDALHRQRRDDRRHRLVAARGGGPHAPRRRRHAGPGPVRGRVAGRGLSRYLGFSTRPLRVPEIGPQGTRPPPGGTRMKLQPLEDRIVVRSSDPEETTVSGLVIPDTAKEKPQQGEVLAVGPGRRAENTGEVVPMDLAVGDTIVYSKYGGTEINIDGEDLLILTSRDVLAKVGK